MSASGKSRKRAPARDDAQPVILTPAEKKVARDILGLPSRGKRSLRNDKSYGVGGLFDIVAQQLVDAGLAKGGVLNSAENRYFLLLDGARAALEPGEELSLNDFPPVTLPPHPSNEF